MSDERVAGRHAYGNVPPFPNWNRETFSVPVFEWVLADDGKSVKRGSVKVRVVGRIGIPRGAVASVCGMIVEKLDAGTYSGPKRVYSWPLS